MARSPFGRLGRCFAPSDEEAMDRVARSGDPQAFALLVRRWEQPIQRLCARMVCDLHRGEDLAQEAFARLFARRSQYRRESRFSTFLWRIALNLCYDHLRRAARRSETTLDDAVQPAAAGGAPEAIAQADERDESVRSAVRSLPEIYRAVVVLRHYEGLKFRQIADVLEVPEGTVKSRMAEALSQLAARLGPGFDGARQPSAARQERKIT